MKNKKKYTPKQLEIIKKGCDCNNKKFGDVTDLDCEKYTWRHLEIISLGRGAEPLFGNINDLNYKYTWQQMRVISLGRGNNDSFGNVDALDYAKYTAKQMYEICLEYAYWDALEIEMKTKIR